jgi:hypothetical protein
VGLAALQEAEEGGKKRKKKDKDKGDKDKDGKKRKKVRLGSTSEVTSMQRNWVACVPCC